MKQPQDRKIWRAPLLLLLALAMVAAACGGAEDTTTEDDGEEVVEETEETEETEEAEEDDEEEAAGGRVEGGTVIFGAEQEPAIVNPSIQEGILFATSVVVAPQLYPLWRITPELDFEPLLLDGEPVVEEGPFRVTYTLKEEAVWSDGTPITARDVEFTWERRVDPEVEVANRTGYDLVTETEIVDDKTITFTFEEVYAPWRLMFSTIDAVILPAHILEGEDLNEVWRDEIPIASGPFQFEDWNRGVDMTLVKNENYWGTEPSLDRIVFRFLEDSSTQVQQLRGGEIDVLAPQPQIDLVEQIEAIDDVVLNAVAGASWEHLNLQADTPELAPLFVRQAIAKGIDRASLVDALIAPIQPDAEPLDSIFYLTNQPEFQPNWSDALAYDPAAAEQLLIDNGCELGDDDVYVCDGVRLSIPYATTTGNERRELTFEVLQAQLADIGIELTADFSEASVLFGTRLFERDFSISAWGWTGTPDPFNTISQWGCTDEDAGTGAQNFTGTCSEEATELMRQANQEIDPDRRVELFQEADSLLAELVPAIPLYQTPTITAYNTRVVGVETNPSSVGPTWNTQDWYLTE